MSQQHDRLTLAHKYGMEFCVSLRYVSSFIYMPCHVGGLDIAFGMDLCNNGGSVTNNIEKVLEYVKMTHSNIVGILYLGSDDEWAYFNGRDSQFYIGNDIKDMLNEVNKQIYLKGICDGRID